MFSITISSPASGTGTSQSPIAISGKVDPVPQGAFVRALGSEMAVLSDGKFSLNVDLIEGLNEIEVAVVDGSGVILASQLIQFTYVIPSVLLSITSPPPGTTSTESQVLVAGTVEPSIPGSLIKVFNVDTFVSADGSFSVEVLLAEGSNRVNALLFGDAGDLLASSYIELIYARPSDGSGAVTVDGGGVVVVDNPESEIQGAGLEIPPGASSRDFTASIIYDPEHTPTLPFGIIACGPPVGFGPESEVFNTDVRVTIPLYESSFPDGVELDDARVLALSDGQWVPVESTLVRADLNAMVLELNSLQLGPFVPVAEMPLEEGQVLIESDIAGALVYIDGVLQSESTPVILDDIPLGERSGRLYLPSFNEIFFSFTSTEKGARLHFAFSVPENPIPQVVLEDLGGLVTSTPFLEIRATVSFEGTPLQSGLAIITTETGDYIQQTQSDGSISGFITLLPGYNSVGVRVTGPNGSTGVSRSDIVKYEPSRRRQLVHNEGTGRRLIDGEVLITLTWNTDNTDIDLHIFDPVGNHAYYGNQDGIPGAMIDVDDTDGFGPEIFTYASPIDGEYRVAVNAYDINCDPCINTVATLTITVGGTQVFTGSYTFTSDDSNDTNGSPIGADPASFWDAATFQIGGDASILISNVEGSTTIWPSYQEAIFTTFEGQNEIFVTAVAPDSVPDSSIGWDIEEVNEGFTIDPIQSGRNLRFKAQNPNPLEGPVNSPARPIEYKITAYVFEVDNGVETRLQESNPIFIRQGKKYTLLQEYADYAAFNPVYATIAPKLENIISEVAYSSTTAAEQFDFFQLSGGSDYSDMGRIAVVGPNVDSFLLLQQSWRYPLTCTLGYVNPRQGDESNILHQAGNAIDVIPSRFGDWPSSVEGFGSVTTFSQALQALYSIASGVFDQNYSISLVNNNLRITREYVPAEPPPSPSPGPIVIQKRHLTKNRIMFSPGVVASVFGGAGVEVGWSDLASKTAEEVESIWVSAGLDADFAESFAEAAGLQYPQSRVWVNQNKEVFDRLLSGHILENALRLELDQSAEFAKATATSTTSIVDVDGRGINARAREIHEGKALYTYVLTGAQWDSLHPAMIEFLTDIYHSGFYIGDPVARVNERLIANHGDHLAQFEAVAELFGRSVQTILTEGRALLPGEGNTGLSYSDEYYSNQVPPSPLGNTETFFDATVDDLKGASTRESRAALAYAKTVSQTLANGYEVTVEEEEKNPVFDFERDYPCYRTVESLLTDAQSLATNYPNLVETKDIGDSWEKMKVEPIGSKGYDIIALKLTNKLVDDPSGSKPKLVLNCGIHGREYVTSEFCLRFAEEMLGNYDIDADATWVLDYHEVHLIVVHNPDGRKRAEGGIAWRKNANCDHCPEGRDPEFDPNYEDVNTCGADLNRNFDFKWSNTPKERNKDPCENVYSGPIAASEPETEAVQKYFDEIFNSDLRSPNSIMFDVHSFAEVVLGPWGYTASVPPKADELALLGLKYGRITNYDYARSYYLVGVLFGEGGIKGNPVDGTTRDYVFGKFGVPAYTVELGLGGEDEEASVPIDNGQPMCSAFQKGVGTNNRGGAPGRGGFFPFCDYFEQCILPKNVKAMTYMSKVVRRPYHYPAGPDVADGRLLAEPNVVARAKDVLITATITSDSFGEFLDRNPEQTKPTKTVAGCAAFIDVPPWVGGTPIPMTAIDGEFDSAEEDVNLVLTAGADGLSVGRHIIYIQATDSDGNRGSASAVFVTVGTADSDILFEHDFETIDPQLEPQNPQCNGAAFFDPNSLFGATGTPPLHFAQRPGTTFEAILLNGITTDGSNQSIYNPKGVGGNYALGGFSIDYIGVDLVQKEDELAILDIPIGKSSGGVYPYVEFIGDVTLLNLPQSECGGPFPYVPGISYRVELNIRLVDALDWNNLLILDECNIYGTFVDGGGLVSPEYQLEWSSGSCSLSTAGITGGQAIVLIRFRGSAPYQGLDNVVFVGKDNP